MLKRFLVLLIAVILLLTCFTDPAVEVFAAPQTHPQAVPQQGYDYAQSAASYSAPTGVPAPSIDDLPGDNGEDDLPF